MRFKRVNLNEAVMVKLTEVGHVEMERLHNEFYASVGLKYRPFTRKASDENGYSTFQLHCLMSTFGHMLICGGDMPFESANIFISDVALKDCEL